MIINALGIDLAKSIFQFHAVNQNEKQIFSKKVKRSQVIDTIATLNPCKIFMEACGSSHYWAKKFKDYGHDVKLIAGQHVKPFVVGNKNDAVDARAIVVAGLRPHTRFVPIKSTRQLELQAIHRIRTRLVKERTALSNEIRGLLYEHGIVIKKGIAYLKTDLPKIISSEMPALLCELVTDLFSEFIQKDKRVKDYEKILMRESRNDDTIKRLQTIPGVGFISASAIVAESHLSEFKNGRGYAAFLGLVPRHTGSGGRNVNHSISKRGDTYIRTLLIHGARSVMRFTAKRDDKISLWCEALKKRRGHNKAVVALANKNARIIWRVLTENCTYDIRKAA